jgi:hypothetical protein
MFRSTRRLEVIAIAMAALVAGSSAAGGREQEAEEGQPVEFKDARLKIETNDTDGDAGIQVFLDSDPWQWIEISDPNGRRLFRSATRGSFGLQGGTELFLESGEPSFDEVSFAEFLARFPEGEYRFRGEGNDDEQFFGTATLTHDIPAGPRLVGPHEGGPLVDPDNAVVRWEPVAPPNGSPIIAYQVLVVLGETGLPALPKLTLDVMMPPTATSLAIPPGFLRRHTLYEWEVLSIEAGGNQTLSSSFFRTAP